MTAVRCANIVTLPTAVSELVRDGDSVAMEGFTHLIPFAAAHEVIRQRRRDLTLIRMTPDLIYDQLIGCGCARKLVFSWGGNPGVGSLHRLRDAIENDWPNALEIDEHSHAGMASAYDAGAAALPFAVLRGYQGGGLRANNKQIRSVSCPFTGEQLAAIPALRPDVTIIHAQRADRKGNVQIEGIVGVQKHAVLAAKRVLVTVEEIVEQLPSSGLTGVIIPSWCIDYVSAVPGGAMPSYAQGYYPRDNRFYASWDAISRDREKFQKWMQDNVVSQSPGTVEAANVSSAMS